MRNFKQEILRVKKFNAEYYDDLIRIADEYAFDKPDIAIETSKAVIEGISKLILEELEQEPSKNLNERKLSKLFKDARQSLAKHIADPVSSVVYDEPVVDSLGGIAKILDMLTNSQIISRVGEIRNEHSDISHGRSSKKQQINDSDLAELVIGLADSICTYMLRKLDQLTEYELKYEDYPEFNDFLDRDFQMGLYGEEDTKPVISFSLALFEQEYALYGEQLEDFKLMNDDSDE